MRQQSVKSILEHAEKDLSKIKVEYKSSLHSKEISSLLQIDVKNLMENLRSALDYIAHDIYERVIKPDRIAAGEKEIKEIYFPYGKDENGFNSRLGACLPKLDILCPTAFKIIERIQPHKCGNDWLFNLCSILNKNKHDQLSPQTREEKRGLKLDFAGGGGFMLGPSAVIKGTGRIISGRGVLDLKGNTISGESPAQNLPPTIKQRIILWVGFRFAGTRIEVLTLLELATKEIKLTANLIYSAI